ncbi:Putative vacuolar membrane protein (Fragment), partial [Durusdinium trenchii]
MVCLPDAQEVTDFLAVQEGTDGQELVLLHVAEVEMATSRGRALGPGPCLLVDCTWELAPAFIRANPLRSAATCELSRFLRDDQHCRPRRAAVEAAVATWLAEVMDTDTAADYLSAEEPPGLGAPAQVEAAVAAPGVTEVEMLRARVVELESRGFGGSPGSIFTSPSSKAAARPTSSGGVLFNSAPYYIPEAINVQERLQQLAESRPEQVLEALQQEEGLEATERQELDDGLQDLEVALTDPLQRLMLLQMKQMNLLAKQAYVKVANDLERVGAVVQANALAELGLDPANIPLGLMREYLEKRTPLADQKMLTQMGYFFAHGRQDLDFLDGRTRNANLSQNQPGGTKETIEDSKPKKPWKPKKKAKEDTGSSSRMRKQQPRRNAAMSSRGTPLLRSSTSERGNCLPTVSCGRGGNRSARGRASQGGKAAATTMSQDAGMGTANFEPMPELPSSGQGAALPEGIQCTEFFLAALKAATTHGGLTPFARHSLERFPNVDGLARCKSDMWPCPPPDLGEMDELELFVTETKEKTQ